MDLLRDLYARFRVLIHEVAKFGVVGIIAFIITLGGANVLHYGAGLGPLTSVTIATVVATVFAFLGNKLWAFRHRNGSHWGRETVLFFVFNGIGLLIQLGVVAAVRYGLGLDDRLSYNVSNIIGIGVATIFRLYCYRRWVFLVADDAPLPRATGAGDLRAADQAQPRTADRPRGALSAAVSCACVRYPTAAIRPMTCTSRVRACRG